MQLPRFFPLRDPCEIIKFVCIYPQSSGVIKHGARGKKQTLKSASTDLGTTDVGMTPHTHIHSVYVNQHTEQYGQSSR